MTDRSESGEMAWSESESRRFIEVGHIHTPNRDEIRQTILDLIPAMPDERFLAVELGVGGGWLSHAILERFPGAHVVGLDGSATMLRETEERLHGFEGRFRLREFRLEDRGWRADLSADVRCFVSSLTIHHLDGSGKRSLYRDLYGHLASPGALIIADLVAPTGAWERRCMARWWEADVKRQSLEYSGSLEVFREFVDGRYNYYDYPDPMDMPSTIQDHLGWLAEAGFTGVDVFWQRAGHAVYGGYRGAEDRELRRTV